MEDEVLIFISGKRKFWMNISKIFYPSPTFLKGCVQVSLLNIVYLLSPVKFFWVKPEIHLISCITVSFLLVLYLLTSLAYFLWLKTGLYLCHYANCMADTFFYGYLRKIVPKPDEANNENLKERLAYYKAIQGFTDETFPFNKLFILIPTNGYIPTTLEKLDPRRITKLQDIMPIRLDRAGVEGRQYKASVYKIYYPNDSAKHITVAMVGTPPLLALAESCDEKLDLKKHKTLLIYLFYKKLLSKLNKYREFKEACELIYFDKDKQGLPDYLIGQYLRSKNKL